MSRVLALAAATLLAVGCKQDLEDAVVPADDFAENYAIAVCENLGDCCDDSFIVADCKLAGEASAQAAIDDLSAMSGAVYHSDRAVKCLQDTEAAASNCEAHFATDCPDVFENVSTPPDAGTADVEAQCAGDLF